MPFKKSKSKSSAKVLTDLSHQLEQQFEGETALQELQELLQRSGMRCLVSLHEQLRRAEKQKKKGNSIFSQVNQTQFLQSVQDALDGVEIITASNDDAADLYELLASPLLNGFAGVLDDIAHDNYEAEIRKSSRPRADSIEPEAAVESSLSSHTIQPQIESPSDIPAANGNDWQQQQQLQDQMDSVDDLDEFDRPQRMVAFTKVPGEELGITIGTIEWFDENTGQSGLDIVVERIMAGSRIDQQGVLKPYDVIKEVNGIPVDSPERLQEVMRKASGNITMKVRSGFYEKTPSSQTYVKALFSYDPQYDGVIPCKEAGLKFTVGDILQVVSQEDPNWWQARLWNDKGRCGLIPSLTLQERRKAFVQSTPDRDAVNYKFMGLGLSGRKKKVKMTYKANVAQSYEKSDLSVYQEVARVPAFKRNLVLLLGATGVGKNSLIKEILLQMPNDFAKPIPHTSRPPRQGEVNGEKYLFAGQQEMQFDIRNGAYLQHGQFNSHLYGIKLDTIRTLFKQQSKTLIVDCNADRVRCVYNAEFRPYVIFIAAPSFECMKSMYELGTSLGYTTKYKRDEDFRRSIQESKNIERSYRHLFDSVLICDNFDACLEQLTTVLSSLTTDSQWLPVSWLY